MNSIAALRFFQDFKQQLTTVYDVEEAQAITNYVLSETLLLKWHQLAYIDKTLSEAEVTYYQNVLKRLLQAEPIHYILGYAWFDGLKMEVNEHTLIPRPETEELVHAIHRYYQKTELPKTIIDLGTGSGCIPIALKKRMPSVRVIGVDVSTQALQKATDNAKLNRVDVDFYVLDVLDENKLHTFIESLPRPIAVVSNPPYIAKKEAEYMHENVLKYEPHTALFVPNDDALLFYKVIAKLAQQQLKKGDTIWLEINPLFATETLALFQANEHETAYVITDMQAKERFVNVLI
jgi:release factor glutamine methyltransferase